MAEERLQRRLAAILSADVVGYSRLMGIDEAGTLARLKAMPLSDRRTSSANGALRPTSAARQRWDEAANRQPWVTIYTTPSRPSHSLPAQHNPDGGAV